MSPSREAHSAGIDGAVMALGLELVQNRQLMLHVPTGVYGRAMGYHSPGEYTGSDGVTIDEHVLEIDAKRVDAAGAPAVHAFLMKPQEFEAVFMALTPGEVQYLDTVAAELAALLTRAIGAALAVSTHPGATMTMDAALVLIGVAMRSQIRALQSAAEEGGAG